MTEEEINQLKAENERYKQELAILKKDDCVAFAEDLIKQGRLAPVAKNNAIALLQYAEAYDKGEVLNFSEGESLSQTVKAFLKTQPQIICFHEIATKERAATAIEEDFTSYAEDTPLHLIDLDQRIRKYMKANNVSYTTAFTMLHHSL